MPIGLQVPTSSADPGAGAILSRINSLLIPEERRVYSDRDTILYALGVGAGLGPDELDLVYEAKLSALPTMTTVLAQPDFWAIGGRLGIDWSRLLHGEQSLRMHRPLPPSGEVFCRASFGAVADKGPAKPLLIGYNRELFNALTGQPLASLEDVYVLMGGGGFGGENRPVSAPLPPMPQRPSDDVIVTPTFHQQALIYRLSSDRNPLHADPAVAMRSGFEKPILHGMATFGMVARGLGHLCAGGAWARISAIRLRLCAPVYPMDSIRTEIWYEAAMIRFRSSVLGRGQIVVDGGLLELDGFTQ